MIDYKEYSRLRSIARKRLERLSAAGLAPAVKLPTVAEVRASDSPSYYMNIVQRVLNDVPTLKIARKRETPVNLPIIIPAPEITKPTDAAKEARRKQQAKAARARKAVRESAPDQRTAARQLGYLKALQTVSKQWQQAGIEAGSWLASMTGKEAKEFVAYLDYRFSQADFNAKYVIPQFIEEFGELKKRGHSLEDIQGDFEKFAAEQTQLKKRRRGANAYGMTEAKLSQLWDKFVKR